MVGGGGEMVLRVTGVQVVAVLWLVVTLCRKVPMAASETFMTGESFDAGELIHLVLCAMSDLSPMASGGTVSVIYKRWKSESRWH